MVVVLVVFAVGALLGGWRPFTSEPDVYTFGAGGDLPAFALFDGQCAGGTLGDGAEYSAAADVPCGDPHDVEVIGSTTPLNESRQVTYPGADEMAAFGRSFCAMVAASGQVAPTASGVDRSALRVAAIVPSEATFDAPNGPNVGSSGGRLVSCVITRTDGQKLTDRFSVI
ncbi:MAG: eukaryotic-like serine/threonine-protein kinase [Actinomycetota bacterium]|nr:eukaryotic-like serine/threonine-protein kinase [Actinomycetota bacterium]